MNDDRLFKISLAVVLLFAAGVVLKAARPILFPFILAVFVSYVIDPVLGFLIKLGIPKTPAVVLVLFGAFVLLFLLGFAVYASGKSFAAALPKYEGRIAELTRSLGEGGGAEALRLRLTAYLDKIEVSTMASFLLRSLGPVVDLLSKLLILFLYIIFIMAGRGRAMGKVRKALPPDRAAQVMTALDAINSQVRKYLAIKTVLSLFNGFVVWLVLTLFGVDFAFFFGFVAFLLNYIPNIGSVLAMVLRVAFAYFQFGNLLVPLWILLITGAIEMVVGNVIEPKVEGKGLGLSALVILFSLLFWGWLWGIPGMIMAVPLVASLRIVCENVPTLRPLAILMG